MIAIGRHTYWVKAVFRVQEWLFTLTAYYELLLMNFNGKTLCAPLLH